MQKKKIILILILIVILISSCFIFLKNNDGIKSGKIDIDGTYIKLSDRKIKVNGKKISEDKSSSIYKANDIIYYEENKGITYGTGNVREAHSKEEANKHIVIHITKPGNYILSGKLSSGQIAIDLGEKATKDPNAVVNLYLNGVGVTNNIAPAIIFYNTYECGSYKEEFANKHVNTSKAGANIFIVDESVNKINGSHVAKIYETGTQVLSKDGRTVIKADTLHKYDAAVYSKQSMNINGNTGKLYIQGDNEGLDTELHLTINGGIIDIKSNDDCINTNKDNVSVTTINGGKLNLQGVGTYGKGDGIDSNGWIVVNDGQVTSFGANKSKDFGLDADKGTYINSGTVISSGHLYDEISEKSKQNFVVFNFDRDQDPGEYILKDKNNNEIIKCNLLNDFNYLAISIPNFKKGSYTLWNEKNEQFIGSNGIVTSEMEFNPNRINYEESLEEFDVFNIKDGSNYFKNLKINN